MFTMAKIRDGSTYLARHLCANDYYAEGEIVTGHWQGALAARLGLAGREIHADDAAFASLRENVNPATGQKLTQRNVVNSVRFFDFQCSAQKSVSVLHALTGDGRLAAAHDRAATLAFAELETFAACRVRAGVAAWSEETQTTANVCAAVFRHDTSRALDPQLHTHFVVANATWDETKGRMVALTEREMVATIRYAGKCYQNALAWEVQALGYDVVPKRDARGLVEGFEVAGVSPALCRRFSKRRAEVEAGIGRFRAERGRGPSAAEVAVITRQTRGSKLTEISTPAVRAAQRAELSAAERAGLDALRAAALARRVVIVASPQRDAERERAALAAAVAHGFERASVLSGHAVLADALNANLGALDLDALKSHVHAGAAGLVALDGDDGRGGLDAAEDHVPFAPSSSLATAVPARRFTTARGLALERWAVGFVNAGQGRCPALLPPRVPLSGWLSDEQRQAVRFVGASRDRVLAVRGVAGAGKTTLLRELDARLQGAGHRLLYLAPTAAAVKVLRTEGFSNATTVADYLTRRTQAQGGASPPAAWRGAVVVVDEAGLASNAQGAAVLRLAAGRAEEGGSGGRVVLVGDRRQHVSVEAGDFLRVLEAHSRLASCELGDIRRQTRAEYNAAVRLLAGGQAAAGVEALDELGWVKEIPADYLAAAAADYLRLVTTPPPPTDPGGTKGKKENKVPDVLCVAPTWAENHLLTDHIRTGLRGAGRLAAAETTITVLDPLSWTTQQRRQPAHYQPGQVVSFYRTVTADACRGHAAFRRGETLAVERVDEGHGAVILTGGRRLDVARAAASFAVAAPREIPLAVGDRLLVRANDKPAGLTNGETLTVERIGADGTLTTAEGKTVPAAFRHFTHGYVLTSHKAQGRTAAHVVVAAAGLDAKAAYVACSRGRQSCVVHTPDKAALFAGLPRSGERRAALDVLRARAGERQRRTAADADRIHRRVRAAAFAAAAATSSPAPEWGVVERAAAVSTPSLAAGSGSTRGEGRMVPSRTISRGVDREGPGLSL